MDPSVQPSLLTTFDLSTCGYYNELYIFNTLNGQLNVGTIDAYSVTAEGFTFRALSGMSAT